MVKNRIRPFQRLLTTVASSVALLFLVFLPVTSSLTVAADPCTPPPDPGPGVHHPVGADASQYTYDCGSGLWVSSHFIYNPSTGDYTASDQTIYTYNPTSGGYDYTVWIFDAPSGQYIALTKSTTSPPAGANVVGAPTPHTNSIDNTGNGSNNTIDTDGSGNSISNTGEGSNNSINNTGNNNTTQNNTTGLNSNNTLTATAKSGNATVLSNTSAGSANTGDVQDTANIVNLLQSSTNALGGNAVTFVANIDGDVNGDLLLDPSALGNIQPASGTGNNTTTINNSAAANITNNINLAADSGNATVDSNTLAGDATSGNAKTIADIVNVIDSAIYSGHSFIGVININGNLNGDILLPPDFVDKLIAANVPTVNIIANTGPSSNNAINATGSNTTNVTNTNNQGITNNISANAASGTADVSGNTSAGDATSGSGKTTITAFNLTGDHVIGANDLLVFVNVRGTWVGLIVNAPAGATAAELGGGVISNTGPSSNNTVNDTSNNNTTVDNHNNDTITNNLNLDSKSGDAKVSNNTKGGNARSGDASAAVNLLNIEDNTIDLTGWFGILFINVFGTWNGSFGVNTSAGDPVAAAATTSSTLPPAATPAFQVFRFIPSVGSAVGSVTGAAGNGDSNAATPGFSATLAAHHGPAKSIAPTPKAQSASRNLPLAIMSVVFFVAYLGIERFFGFARTRSRG